MPPMGEAPATAAHPPKRKTGVIRAASQNVNGKFRGGGDGVYKDVIRAMGEGKFQIAMLQDTQHAYSPESDYQQGSPSAPLFTHGPPGQAVCYHGEAALPGNAGPGVRKMWPFSAVWSASDREASNVRGSAGCAIFLGSMAAAALDRSVKTNGHEGTFLLSGPRVLAIRLVFLDAMRKRVSVVVASSRWLCPRPLARPACDSKSAS